MDIRLHMKPPLSLSDFNEVWLIFKYFRFFFVALRPNAGQPTISAGERPQAAHLLRSWVRIPPRAWIFVCCERRVLSGRGLCDELISRPEESYRLWCVVVCDLETSRMRRPWPALGRSATKKKRKYLKMSQTSLKSDKDNGVFIWRRMSIYDNISVNFI